MYWAVPDFFQHVLLSERQSAEMGNGKRSLSVLHAPALPLNQSHSWDPGPAPRSPVEVW